MISRFFSTRRMRIVTASVLTLAASTSLPAFSNRAAESDETPQIEVVGPSVLLNARERGVVTVLDFRARGRRVPGAIAAAKWRPSDARNPLFLLGDEPNAREWAQKRQVRASIIPPRMIEFHALAQVPQIAPRAAKTHVEIDDWPLFDISEAPEFAASRLPGSKRLDYAGFRARRWQQLPKDRPFIVACRVGHRSQLVVQTLRARGYDARNLDGGLWGWECDGLKVER